MSKHPITPPPELVEQLRNDAPYGIRDAGVTRERHLVFAAYRAGADAELEACREWLREAKHHGLGYEVGAMLADRLRAAMRPKPPSVAEQGQRILVENGRTLDGRVELDFEDVVTINAALKRLQELENNDN
jgi:hypothetical protein